MNIYEQALVDIYMSIHVSELIRVNDQVSSAWHLGQALYKAKIKKVELSGVTG